MKPYYRSKGITIYHGDCREILPRLAPVDMVFMDPPYGHNNNNGDLIHRREAALGRLPSGKNPPAGRPIRNDGPEANQLLKSLLPLLKEKLRSGGCCCCCCGGGGPDPQFARWSLWLDEVFNFTQMVVWDKGPMGMGWRYRRSYETVLVASKPGAPMRWYDDSRKVENIIRHIRKIIPRAADHPTPKPVTLAEHFIGLHSQEGDAVLDPFAGAGGTLVAARNLSRKAIGIEIEEKYCEVAARRLEGLKVKKTKAA